LDKKIKPKLSDDNFAGPGPMGHRRVQLHPRQNP
jgi:hypothetical protein